MPLSPAYESPFAGTCRVPCPWRGTIPSSKCTPKKGNTVSQCDPGDPYTSLCTPRTSSSFSPGAQPLFCCAKCPALPEPQSLSFTYHLQETCDTQYSLLPCQCLEEASALCKPEAALSQSLSLPFSFLSLWKEMQSFSLPSMATVFLPPNSLPCVSHLPQCLPPTMELLLPVLRSVSWMFQVI